MIYNNMEELKQAAEQYSYLKQAILFLESSQLEQLDEGKHELCGAQVYANVESYETRPLDQTRFETHEKYIDIQYLIEGKEEMAVTNRQNLEIKDAYQADRDVTFYESTVSGEHYLLEPGEFLVFFPEDAHRPCIAPQEKSGHVKKMVIKVLVDGEE